MRRRQVSFIWRAYVQQCSRLLSEIELRAFTDNTITSIEQLKEHLAATTARGYSLDDEEFITGMTAVAVAVVDKNGRYVASLAVHAPKSRMSVADARGHVELLQDAALRIGEGIADNAS